MDERVPLDRKSDIDALWRSVRKRPAADRERLEKTIERYAKEGEAGSYTSDTRGLRAFIGAKALLKGSPSAVDLGAGSGDLLAELARERPSMKILGIDLSPSFVRRFRERKIRNAVMRVGLIDSPDSTKGLGKFMDGSALSVLTLDRVADPRQLLANMGRFKGSKILGTLLPINPVDDNPSRQGAEKITYTRPEMRITPGRDGEEDGGILLKLLNTLWGGGVRADVVPYSVGSSGDMQDYDLAVFSKK